MAANSTWNDLLDLAATQLQEARPLIPMYIHLIVSALFPIYAGAFASLSRPASAAKRDKTSPQESKDVQDEEEDDEEEETVQQMEGLQPSDAIVFPIMAGTVLAGLYFLIKRYGAQIINLVLGWYFSVVGIYSVGTLLNDSLTVLDNLIFPTYFREQGTVWGVNGAERKVVPVKLLTKTLTSHSSPLPLGLGRLPLPRSWTAFIWKSRELSKQKYQVKGYLKSIVDFKATVRQHTALAAVLGVAAVGYSIFVDKPWWLTNLQGFGVSYGALQLMSPTTFTTGSLILSGLFFYDIWAVFFTPLMVTVAKNLDVPIKLVFPRPDEPEQDARSYSMLGLGDIVLPGIMIALALRFDLYVFYLKKQKRSQADKTDPTGAEKNVDVKKAPYIPVSGRWGDKLWTFGAPTDQLPAILTQSFPKPYFTASMIGYVVGMVTTLVAMSLMQHAQPALLYLVPGVLLSLWGTALARGELKVMLDYSEAITGEALDEEQQDSSKASSSDDNEKDDSPFSSWSTLFDRAKWAEYLFGKDDAKSEDQSDTKSSSQAERTSSDKDSTPKDTDPNLLFNFSVTLHRSLKQNSASAVSDNTPISTADLAVSATSAAAETSAHHPAMPPSTPT